VVAQIQQMDSHLEKAIEAYDLANSKLGGIDRDLRQNEFDLGVARANLKRAQQLLAARLVSVYTQTDANSTLEVVLGATSLDDLLSRIDATDRVSSQNAQILGEVIQFRTQIRHHEVELKRARKLQASVVAERASEKASIESQLAERQRYLASVKNEIAQLEAQERAREAEMARQAAARLQQQRAAQQVQINDTVVGPSISTPEGVTVAPPSRYGGVVGVAMQFLGTPYVWGGASPGGFDCSGLVMYVYSQLGVSLPHNAAAQYGYGTPVSVDQLQPGDLVFFDGLGHVGIYIGGGQFIHAPHTGDVVKISSLSDPWYAATFVGARRL
jgi:cell wall-associated NlpC family hydrolase